MDDKEQSMQRAALLQLFEDLRVPDDERKKRLDALKSDDIRVKADAKLLAYFAVGRKIRLEKQADYGLTWREYGLLGTFFNIGSKVGRLKSLVWHNQEAQVKGESVWDTLIDLLNYTGYALFNLEDKNMRGKAE